MTATEDSKTAVSCSFCLKATADVTAMVAGPGVYICDECVGLCVQLIEAKPAVMRELAPWEERVPDEDLLAMLPKVAAVSTQADRQLARAVAAARHRGITWTRIGASLGMTRQSAWERFSGGE